MAEGSEQLGDILILLKHPPHLVSGISAIPTELASECIRPYIAAVIFILRQPCIAMMAFSSKSAWHEWIDLVIGARGEAASARVGSIACSRHWTNVLWRILHDLWPIIPIEDE
jgi:hypothetical protein